MLARFESEEKVRLWSQQQQWIRERFDQLVPALLTKDGLLPTSEIRVHDDGKVTLERDFRVPLYPHWRARAVARSLVADPALWERAAIRVLPAPPVAWRAPVFGVPFEKAIRIVLTENSHKSVFWLPRKNSEVLYSELLVRLRRGKESNGEYLNLESWEWIGEGVEVDYAHMILTSEGQRAIHLDGALVTFASAADIASIFGSGEKRKGVTYEKFFRVDGNTQLETAIGLIRHFFPVEELVDEYFEHVPSWLHAYDAR